MAKYEREIVLPPEALRHPIRFQLDAIRNHVIRRVIRTAERGVNGEIPKKKLGSVAIGLKGYLALLDRVAPVPKTIDAADANAPVQVNIVLGDVNGNGHDPRPVLQSNGLRLHLGDGERGRS